MSLSREDMLRELELLPMWRSRMPPVLGGHEPGTTLPVEQLPEPQTLDSAPIAQRVVEAPSLPEHTEAEMQDAPVAIPATPTMQPEVTTPWLLVCPHSADADQQRLLQAIIQALHLPENDWTLSSNALAMAAKECRNVVLFGVEAANAFFNITTTEGAPLRGQLQQHGNTRVVITHHPAQILAQPLLKREVWHDLCLLLEDNASRSSQA